MRLPSLVSLLALLASPALAVDSANVNGVPAAPLAPGGAAPAAVNYAPIVPLSIAAATIGVTSAQALAAPANPRTFIIIENESASATIACNFGGTAALNTAGSWTIPPQTQRTWSPGMAPQGAVNCIASGASTPATILSY